MSKLYPFKLLYAEDDNTISIGYVKYFKTLFQNVYTAADGKEAYNLYLSKQPDILIFDINMPHINGLEVIEKIRQKNKNVKIIILSAHSEGEKLLRAIPLGLEDYLIKPVKKRKLDEKLFKVISELELEKSKLIYFSSTIYFDKENKKLFDNNVEIHLTKNEIILLNLFTSQYKNEYSIEDILEEFWDITSQDNMTHDAVRNIIKRLKPKLPPETIKNNYGLGYKLIIKN